MSNFFPTGNEFISLPNINSETGGIENLTVLYMKYKGLLELCSNSDLFGFYAQEDEEAIPLRNPYFKRVSHWIPAYTFSGTKLSFHNTILAPIDQRGFIYSAEVKNISGEEVTAVLGLRGNWSGTLHCINESKPVDANMHVYESQWNDAFAMDLRCGFSILALAPCFEKGFHYNFSRNEDGIDYEISSQRVLYPGETWRAEFFWGIGFEEVAAVTSAKEMMRQGYVKLLGKTVQWLQKRTCGFEDGTLERLYNENLFFNLFYAAGKTLDTEELVLVTSRSPRYYVSAAYWDRDSLLWSFPAVLTADAERAKEMLDYAFTTQIKNVGVHSRYIDGTALEPGFELDELCAPLLALNRYTEETGDTGYLKTGYISDGVKRILKILFSKKHPEHALFETFLQPTDDTIVYPYLTYDNVLVWKVLGDTARLFRGILPDGLLRECASTAAAIPGEIYAHCLTEADGRKIFAWSTDLQGNCDIYDEPPGSLQLLCRLGFCSPNDEIYRNTVEHICSPDYEFSFAGYSIDEIGCPHARHPWILSIANGILCGRLDREYALLKKLVMDNGIACESVSEYSGTCETGAAFATCAGFLAYAIYCGYGPKGKNIN